MINRKISVAPMMDWTDRHDRYFLRLISPNVLLYTEMITAQALIHGDVKWLLDFDPFEHPVALQLGGNDPGMLAHCAKLGEEFGYDEINLNVGCPSDRVRSGSFGACLMLQPNVVAECVAAMRAVVHVPVTVKCRIGVDQQDSYEALVNFIQTIASSGCDTFIIHARKAWLNGLSPKENREIPPLRYDIVKQLKKDFPHLTIIVNGGIKTLEQVEEQLSYADGVMIGREAYTNPFFLNEIEKKFFSSSILRTRHDVMQDYLPYIHNQLQNQVRLSQMTRHILGLFLGQRNAKMWRRYLSENTNLQGAGIEVVQDALALVKE